MAKELTPLDITDTPELLCLAEEVARTRESRLLRRGGEDLAVLKPISPIRKRKTARTYTKEDDEAFLAAAGGWKGNVNVDKFLKSIDENRKVSRPLVEL